MKAPRRHMLPAAWALMVALGAGLIVTPSVRSIGRLRAQMLTLEAQIGSSGDAEARVAMLQGELEQVTHHYETQTTPIPAQSHVADLIRDLTHHLNSLDIRDHEVTTGAPVAFEQALSMPMSVTIKGPFLSVFETIQWVESLPRLVRVQRVKMELPKRPRDGVITQDRPIEAQLLLDVLFSPQDETQSDETGAGA